MKGERETTGRTPESDWQWKSELHNAGLSAPVVRTPAVMWPILHRLSLANERPCKLIGGCREPQRYLQVEPTTEALVTPSAFLRSALFDARRRVPPDIGPLLREQNLMLDASVGSLLSRNTIILWAQQVRQTDGDTRRLNAHLRALVPESGFEKEGTFFYNPVSGLDVMEEMLRRVQLSSTDLMKQDPLRTD